MPYKMYGIVHNYAKVKHFISVPSTALYNGVIQGAFSTPMYYNLKT